MGFELELNHNISKNYSWFANFTHMNTSVANEIDTDQDGANISFAPDNVVNVGLSIFTPFGLNIVPTVNFTGKYFDSTSKTSRREFSPGLLMNLLMTKQILNENSFLLDLFVKVYNITDNRYEMPWQFRNTGIAFSTGLKIILI
jgi:outer membrane receptor for monomeric catechols